MKSHSENPNSPTSQSPEAQIQDRFDDVQPKFTSPVDVEGAFAKKVAGIVIKEKKIKRHDDAVDWSKKIGEWAIVAFLGYYIPTWIWPLIHPIFIR